MAKKKTQAHTHTEKQLSSTKRAIVIHYIPISLFLESANFFLFFFFNLNFYLILKFIESKNKSIRMKKKAKKTTECTQLSVDHNLKFVTYPNIIRSQNNNQQLPFNFNVNKTSTSSIRIYSKDDRTILRQ